MTTEAWIITLIVAMVTPVMISYIVQALRKKPKPSNQLSWAPEIPVQYVTVDGVQLRYIASGSGKPLVLMHTINSQLDLFQKVIPKLSKHFKVYAFDYPGHGWSDIPNVAYKPEIFINAAEGFIEKLDIKDAIVAGISIGGVIPLVLAARQNARIKKVISINPFDYGKGNGVQRSSFLANLIISLSKIPIVGGTVMRLNNPLIDKTIFYAGVNHRDSVPSSFLREYFEVGGRPGYTKAFISLFRNAYRWDHLRKEYKNINIPVLLLYGEDDWSFTKEREAHLEEIPGAQMKTINNTNHYLSFDNPSAVIDNIIEFSGVTT